MQEGKGHADRLERHPLKRDQAIRLMHWLCGNVKGMASCVSHLQDVCPKEGLLRTRLLIGTKGDGAGDSLPAYTMLCGRILLPRSSTSLRYVTVIDSVSGHHILRTYKATRFSQICPGHIQGHVLELRGTSVLHRQPRRSICRYGILFLISFWLRLELAPYLARDASGLPDARICVCRW